MDNNNKEIQDQADKTLTVNLEKTTEKDKIDELEKQMEEYEAMNRLLQEKVEEGEEKLNQLKQQKRDQAVENKQLQQTVIDLTQKVEYLEIEKERLRINCKEQIDASLKEKKEVVKEYEKSNEVLANIIKEKEV